MRPFSRFTALLTVMVLAGVMRAPAGLHLNPKAKVLPTIQAVRGGSVNHSSNIQFWQTNYAELFLDISVANGKAGTFWPRGYGFSYIFGGGFWFGAVKNNVRHVLVGYNPATGGAWFQPGTVGAAKAFYDSVQNSPVARGRYPNESDNDFGRKFTIYYGTDFNQTTGKPNETSKKLPPWPIWDTSPDDNVVVGENHYYGEYVEDVTKRDLSVYPIRYVTRTNSQGETVVVKKGGPAFVSEEDMFTVCNDMDTTYYSQKSNGRFYPLQCEVQRTIYSWGSEVNKNYVFIVYKIYNRSNAVLDSCWLAPVMDADIGNATNDENGYYIQDTTLNLALQWSDKEAGVPLASAATAYPGVIGMDFLESPTVYKKGEVADSLVGTIKPGSHPNNEQLGLVRFKRWENGSDPTDDDSRYTFMTERIRDTALGQPSDKRFLMATGPFKLLPGQSSQVVVGLMIARDSAQGDANLEANKQACITLDKRAQVVYDSNFRVPLPPSEPKFLEVKQLSGGTFLKWDSLAEFSFDPIGDSIDFMGYRLYRGRRDLIGANNSTLYDQYKNPYGYKLLKEWKLSDLDTLTFKALQKALPSDNASTDVRQKFYNQIAAYMDSLTNHRTYYDFGDDDHNGTVADEERLLNDVDYYYWIAAFDEGNPGNGVISQQTTGKVGQSKVRVHPVSSYAGDNSSYTILAPQGSLGGISNFQWRVVNQEVINQLLAGDTLSVTFTPHLYDLPQAYRTYGFDMRVRDDNKSVDVNYPYYGTHQFPSLYSTSFVAATQTTFPLYVPSDTTTIKTIPFGEDKVLLPFQQSTLDAGLFRSADTGFAPNQYLLNAIEHTANFSYYQAVKRAPAFVSVSSTPLVDTTISYNKILKRWITTTRTHQDSVYSVGWVLARYGIAARETLYTSQRLPVVHIDTAYVNSNGDSVIQHLARLTADPTYQGLDPFAIVGGSDTVAMYYENTNNTVTFDSAADMGQYDYILEFKTGGVEYDTIYNVPYAVPYLDASIRAEQVYIVKDIHNNDSTVRTVFACTPVSKVIDGQLMAGQFGFDQCLWKMSPSSNTDSTRASQWKGYQLNNTSNTHRSSTGLTTARYYLTAQGIGSADTNTIVFVNRLTVGGATMYLDSANKQVNKFSRVVLPGQYLHPAAHDFKVGDAVRIRYTGGMLGMPTPGAGFKTVFTTSVPQPDSSKITSSQLANVHVWPNPYIAGNSVDPNAPGLQKPSLADRMVFNHLPPQCTIKLFNIAGELIRTINHTGGSEEYWDLLSEGRQRVGSQLVVAQVETVTGETQILKIAVIVQGR